MSSLCVLPVKVAHTRANPIGAVLASSGEGVQPREDIKKGGPNSEPMEDAAEDAADDAAEEATKEDAAEDAADDAAEEAPKEDAAEEATKESADAVAASVEAAGPVAGAAAAMDGAAGGPDVAASAEELEAAAEDAAEADEAAVEAVAIAAVEALHHDLIKGASSKSARPHLTVASRFDRNRACMITILNTDRGLLLLLNNSDCVGNG